MNQLAAEILADRAILYVFKMEGCHACALALPEVDKFRARHPDMQVLVLDANGPYPERLGVKIRATPTYAFRFGDTITVAKRDAVLRATDLEKWIKQILAE